MYDRPIRIQGGVFIWLCAVFAAGTAIGSVWSLCSGFWELVLSIGCACVVFRCAHCVFRDLMLRHAESIEGEKGPLLGITIATVAVFLVVYFRGIHVPDPGSDASWVASLFRALAECALFAAVIWMVARGLNGRDLDLRYGVLKKRYEDLGEGAQVAVITFFLLASLSLFFTCAVLLADGLSLSLWEALGGLVLSSAAYLVLLSKSRRMFYALFTGIVQPVGDRRFNPREHKDLWGDDFSLCEICAAVTSGSLVALLFMAFPQWQELHCLRGVFGGVVMAYVLGIVFLSVNRARCGEILREHWRKEVRSFLDANGIAQEEKRVELIKARAVAGLDFSLLGEWQPDAQLLATSERLRKLLNYHFCEDGRMRYLNSPAVVRKDVAYRRQAEVAIDGIVSLQDLGVRYDDLSDEELEALVRELDGEGEVVLSAKDDERVEAYARQLKQMIAETDLQPYATLSAEFSGICGGCQLEFRIEASGKVCVSPMSGKILSCDMDSVLETVDAINSLQC